VHGLVVLHQQLDQPAFHLGGEGDGVGAHRCVVGAGMEIDLDHGDGQNDQGQSHNADTDQATEFSFVVYLVMGHSGIHLQAKKQSQSRQVNRTTMPG
jgi:hypothetical protein